MENLFAILCMVYVYVYIILYATVGNELMVQWIQFILHFARIRNTTKRIIRFRRHEKDVITFFQISIKLMQQLEIHYFYGAEQRAFKRALL